MTMSDHGCGFDTVLAGGSVVLPDGSLASRDIGIVGDSVAAVEMDLGNAQAGTRLEMRDRIVSPGLIDMHCHLFHGPMRHSTRPDYACLPQGVTCAVDMGTSGCNTYYGLREGVIDKSRTRVFAFLNLGAAGFATLPMMGEISQQSLVNVDEIVGVARSDRDHIRGIKMRYASDALESNDGWQMLDHALAAADVLDLPVMVHLAECPVPIGEVLDRLRPGDVATHLFHGGENGSLAEDGRILESVIDAISRGVLLDVGHGGWHFDMDVTRALAAEQIWPHTISTDSWAKTVYPGAEELPLYSLPSLVSQFIGLGMPIEQALAAVTRNPASVLQRTDVGTLAVGSRADIGVFREVEGRFQFRDRYGKTLDTEVCLVPELVMVGGEIVQSSDRFPYTDPTGRFPA